MTHATDAVVLSVQRCPGIRQPMEPLDTATFEAGRGIAGDRHAGPGKSRQVLLIESETLDRFGLTAGIVKENVTTRGIALMPLPVGTRLRLGDAVLLELTGECEPCERMDEIMPGLQAELQQQRGMLARVLAGGAVRPGDRIVLAPEVE